MASVRADLLKHAGRRGQDQSRLIRRFTIMVLVRRRVSPRMCTWYVDCSLATVRRWSGAVEQSSQLLDRPGRGRQPLFGEALRLRVIGFYCQSRLPGCRCWSFSWAASYLNGHLEILGRTISASTIHRILHGHSLRPHRVDYFLRFTDPDFFPKMEHIIALILSPPPYLFCLDECSGIQALERLALPIIGDNGIRIESEYKRHGTVDFIGIFEVATGQVFGDCTPNHLKETVTALFSEHVARQPADAVLHYICDNLAAHSTEVLCQAVAELSGVSYPRLETAKQRREWLQSDHKRIIFHFTPYHGSWLNLIEIWFGILHGKCNKGTSFASVDELRDAILSFRDTWNENFAHPFNWTYTGEGLAEKVVRRFCQWLALEPETLKQKFLLKQLGLMINLARDYWDQVPEKQWLDLQGVLADHQDYLERCMAGSEETEAAGAPLLRRLADILSLQLIQGHCQIRCSGTDPHEVSSQG